MRPSLSHLVLLLLACSGKEEDYGTSSPTDPTVEWTDGAGDADTGTDTDTDTDDSGPDDTGGDDSGPDDTGGDDTGGDDTGDGDVPPDIDIQPIWDAARTGCHTGGGASGGLALDDGYTALVDVASSQLPSMDRVEPGDPDNSYLWHKLQGTQADVGGTGSQMPASGSLTREQIALIRQWIEGGALP